METSKANFLCEKCGKNPISSKSGTLEVCSSCFASSKLERILESGKLVFAIVGCAGFAGCLSAMHWLLGFVAIALISCSWYGIYKVTEVI